MNTLKGIYRVSLEQGTSQGRRMDRIISDVYEPNGIAIDWINKNIYYTDAQYGAIFMTNKNGKYRKRILSGLAAPRYLAIDPLQGALFWTDAVDGTVNMASSNGPTQVHSNPDLQKPYLVLNDKHRGVWPNQLCLDPHQVTSSGYKGKIYWIDGYKKTIETMDYLGWGLN